MTHRLTTATTATITAVLVTGCTLTAGADTASEVPAIRAALADLTITAEHPDGYDRDLFADWRDDDGDGCDTRDEVLLAETLTSNLSEADCGHPMTGRWTSLYDDVTVTHSSDLDIDHLVPLAEAWASGAHDWDAGRRGDYATSLDDSDHLLAVTAASNRSKSDQDPAEWMPTNTDATCQYLAAWIHIKTDWALSIDQAEHDALTTELDTCS